MNTLQGTLAIAIIAIGGAPNLADAAKIKMVCENPRREYVVAFDDVQETILAGGTRYRVLAVEKTKRRLVVAGLTVSDGPTFRAHFRPYKKVEYFTDNQLMQTDGCR